MKSQNFMLVINLVIFKIIWLCCLLLQNLAIGFCALLFAFNFSINKNYSRDLKIVAGISIIGIGLDLSLSFLKIMVFPTPFIPLWLIVLWLQFSLTIAYGFQFIEKLPLWGQSLLGAVTGGGSYSLAMTTESIGIYYTQLLSTSIIGISWAFILPLFFWYSKKIKNA